ncbi:hypothetical protein VRRI112168_20245 [Vreelandella rituensis]|uniref:Transposase n=1 Tax=Vreelandella rituensis TaxID=2282306 RepID=A0A368TM09_9GAMM|nr:hypothetical protein [Halomonas rituensis]RCV85675.1 hypothetical protein DU506_20980 [Halomonas rituensis]
MSQIPTTLKEKRRFWHSHLEAWRDSGLSMAGYARQAGLSSKSLSYWHGKIRHESSPAATTQRPRLLPVSVAATTAPDTSESSASNDAGLCLVTRQGQRVEIATDFDPATLQRLLTVLETSA